MSKQDELFRRMASLYTEQYGREMKEKLRELEQGNVRYHTPRMDQRIRKQINRGKGRRYAQGIALLAACVALMLMIPQFLTRQSTLSSPAPQDTADAAVEAAEPEEAWDEDPADGGEAAPEMEAADSPAAQPALIPLSFSLPGEFAVADAEQDNETSVYYLSNRLLDDVVMTMEYVDGEPAVFDGLVALEINHSTAYAAVEPDYSLMTFEKEDVLYTLTCKHDINTLVELSQSIL